MKPHGHHSGLGTSHTVLIPSCVHRKLGHRQYATLWCRIGDELCKGIGKAEFLVLFVRALGLHNPLVSGHKRAAILLVASYQD
jgi:hypothetical protein